ncbi:MAG: mandelate racemase/muconate lactonizing enzyme family protein [Xanthobacteraceae bacterium]
MLERTQSKGRRASEQPPLVIRRVDAIPVALPLTAPVTMSGITIATADNILVRIEAADGAVGWGEAASAPTMTGDTLGGLNAAVRDHLAPLLVGQDAWQRTTLMRALKRVLVGNGGAHSAVEMALLDLTGRSSGKPFIDLIAKPRRTRVPPMWLLGNKSTAATVAEAKAKAAEGIRFFKVKIGVRPLAEEIATTLAVREALGPKIPICADANCGQTLATARRYVQATRPAQLSFVEQPLPHDDLKDLKALTRGLKVPIGIDEGIHAIADIESHARAGAGGVSLKFIKLGGITPALKAANLCKRLGLKVNIAAKMAESSVAAAATVALACAAPNIDWGVSLTHFYLADDIVRRPLSLRDGFVALPQGPGLGVAVDEAAIERYRVK